MITDNDTSNRYLGIRRELWWATTTPMAGLGRVNQRVVQRQLRKFSRKVHTQDIDTAQIIADKRSTEWTHKGEQGYMPMVGHLAEAKVVIPDDFLARNVAPFHLPPSLLNASGAGGLRLHCAFVPA
jgi:hypothetical protein